MRPTGGSIWNPASWRATAGPWWMTRVAWSSTSNGWIAQRAAPDNLDLYFFGYGHDYVGCLQDFQQVAGPDAADPPLDPGQLVEPLSGLTTEAELKALMTEFRTREFPLSVCIVDMDWHTTQTGNRSVGWTGYTWNRELFPDPQASSPGSTSRGCAPRSTCTRPTASIPTRSSIRPWLRRGHRPGDGRAGGVRHRRPAVC